MQAKSLRSTHIMPMADFMVSTADTADQPAQQLAEGR
jgi:hypothetical protein